MGLITDPNGKPSSKPKENNTKRNDDHSSVTTVETSISQWAHYAADLIFSVSAYTKLFDCQM